MRHNPFESQLERLARTLTEQYGVDVVCQGEQAFTDGRTIVLPSLPEPLEGDLERMMVGYLDHEMAHSACRHLENPSAQTTANAKANRTGFSSSGSGSGR